MLSLETHTALYHFSLLAGMPFSIISESSHVLVPPLLSLFSLTNQNQLLLHPLPALCLVLLIG